MIGDEPIGSSVRLFHVWYMGPGTINVAARYVPAKIQLGDRLELVLIQPPLGQYAVDFFAGPSLRTIGQVFDLDAVRKLDFAQVAEYVIVVGRGFAAFGLGQQLSGFGPGVAGSPKLV